MQTSDRKNIAYLLATIGTKVQWYVVDINRHGGLSGFLKGDFYLADVLDLEVVSGFGDKDTAKRVAMAIGLTTWRYVKMDGPKKVLTLLEK
jgi:hypothetical protein